MIHEYVYTMIYLRLSEYVSYDVFPFAGHVPFPSRCSSETMALSSDTSHRRTSFSLTKAWVDGVARNSSKVSTYVDPIAICSLYQKCWSIYLSTYLILYIHYL